MHLLTRQEYDTLHDIVYGMSTFVQLFTCDFFLNDNICSVDTKNVLPCFPVNLESRLDSIEISVTQDEILSISREYLIHLKGD